MKEVSKEIATELKSEIREVINKVEDVLENSESSLDMSSITMNSLNNLSRLVAIGRVINLCFSNAPFLLAALRN